MNERLNAQRATRAERRGAQTRKRAGQRSNPEAGPTSDMAGETDIATTQDGPVEYPTLRALYAADERRKRSGEADYGVHSRASGSDERWSCPA